MAEEIEDGTGNGHRAKVDSDNRLVTFSITETEDKHENRLGKQWSIPIKVVPTVGVSVFFSLENTGAVPLAITDIRSFCAGAGEEIVMEWATGTPAFGSPTTITAVPKNGGSSSLPVATITQDTKTTGLTSDGIIYYQVLDTANKEYKLSTSANIIIPQGSIFTMSSTTGALSITSIVSIVEIDEA